MEPLIYRISIKSFIHLHQMMYSKSAYLLTVGVSPKTEMSKMFWFALFFSIRVHLNLGIPVIQKP